jgi:hypothetical protein
LWHFSDIDRCMLFGRDGVKSGHCDGGWPNVAFVPLEGLHALCFDDRNGDWAGEKLH